MKEKRALLKEFKDLDVIRISRAILIANSKMFLGEETRLRQKKLDQIIDACIKDGYIQSNPARTPYPFEESITITKDGELFTKWPKFYNDVAAKFGQFTGLTVGLILAVISFFLGLIF